jgi:hypothetical protein
MGWLADRPVLASNQSKLPFAVLRGHSYKLRQCGNSDSLLYGSGSADPSRLATHQYGQLAAINCEMTWKT